MTIFCVLLTEHEKLQESKKKAKQLSIPHLLRNQTPHSPVGAHGVPEVQAITARPQDMTKITEIMENIG